MSKMPQPSPTYKRGAGQIYVLSCKNVYFSSSKHMFWVVGPDPNPNPNPNPNPTRRMMWILGVASLGALRNLSELSAGPHGQCN